MSLTETPPPAAGSSSRRSEGAWPSPRAGDQNVPAWAQALLGVFLLALGALLLYLVIALWPAVQAAGGCPDRRGTLGGDPDGVRVRR